MIDFESNFLCEDMNLRGQEVKKAYHKIIEQILPIVDTAKSEIMRRCIIIENSNGYAHQFLSPLMHLRLTKDLQWIAFAKDLELKPYFGVHEYHNLYRIIFEATKRENTSVNIEDCLDEYEYFYSDFEDALELPDA